MDTQTYRALQSERGRRGGLKSARVQTAKRLEARRALDRQWPRCPECGTRTHMGICPACG